MIRILYTKVIELGQDKNLVLRIQDNDTVDVAVELSETECYGVEVPRSEFIVAMSECLFQLREEEDN